MKAAAGKVLSILLAGVAVLGVLATPALAAPSQFLEIPGIDGEQATLGHPDVIRITSYSFDTPNDLTFIKPVDGTSDDFLLHTALGTQFPTASLLLYNDDPLLGPPDSVVNFQQMQVTSYQVINDGNEQVSIHFVPEPMALSLLPLAAALLRRRRRNA